VALLHVRDSRPQGNNQDGESADEANTRLREILQTHPEARAVAPFIVKVGSPAEVVIAFAKERHMDLIVMGCRAWADDSPPMWRTAYAIVTQAPCPVLSMRSAEALDAETTSTAQVP